MIQPQTPFGSLFRSWREQRRISQLALAAEAEISQKHLSFIESGRSVPSRDMVLRLCENLDIPLRERNTLLLAAGYAPFYPERSLDDPSLESALRTIETILEASAPNPALAIDRHWNMVIGSSALNPLIVGADPDLLKPPVNVMRLSLHPRGLASRIINLREWRRHLLHRLERQFRLSCDPEIGRLLDEVSLYQRDSDDADRRLGGGGNEIAVPLRLRTQAGVISFISTVTVFGTPAEISLSELSIETFYPADDVSAGLLMKLSGN